MLEIEIIGTEKVIQKVKGQIQEKATQLRIYEEKGTDGVIGTFGVIMSLAKDYLPLLIDIFKLINTKEKRGLIVNINGIEIYARDLEEAERTIDFLKEKGILD